MFEEICWVDGVLLRGDRLVIPTKLRADILALANEDTHMKAEKPCCNNSGRTPGGQGCRSLSKSLWPHDPKSYTISKLEGMLVTAERGSKVSILYLSISKNRLYSCPVPARMC